MNICGIELKDNNKILHIENIMSKRKEKTELIFEDEKNKIDFPDLKNLQYNYLNSKKGKTMTTEEKILKLKDSIKGMKEIEKLEKEVAKLEKTIATKKEKIKEIAEKL